MRGARFVGTDLSLGDASNAAFGGADFSNARIERFKLHAAQLEAAMLGGARGKAIGTDEHRLVAQRYRPAPFQPD